MPKLLLSDCSNVVLMLIGSLNPIHKLHIRMLEIARKYLSDKGIPVSKAIISAAGDSYRKIDLVPSVHRLNMIRLGTQRFPWIVVSDWEARQPEWIRTADLLKHHAQSLDRSDQLMLVVGADIVTSFFTPNLYSDEHIESFVREYGLIVIDRNQIEVQSLIDKHAILSAYRVVLSTDCGALMFVNAMDTRRCVFALTRPGAPSVCETTAKPSNIHILPCEDDSKDCSSTSIRESLSTMGTVNDNWIEPAVLDYIIEHKLYGIDSVGREQ